MDGRRGATGFEPGVIPLLRYPEIPTVRRGCYECLGEGVVPNQVAGVVRCPVCLGNGWLPESASRALLDPDVAWAYALLTDRGPG